MTRLEDRQILIRDIAQACMEGARLAPACALAGIDVRTLQRWKVTAQVGRSKQVCGRVCAGKNLLLAANSPVARDAESYLGTPEGYLVSYDGRTMMACRAVIAGRTRSVRFHRMH